MWFFYSNWILSWESLISLGNLNFLEKWPISWRNRDFPKNRVFPRIMRSSPNIIEISPKNLGFPPKSVRFRIKSRLSPYQGVSNLEMYYSFYCITSAWQIQADGLTWHFRRFQWAKIKGEVWQTSPSVGSEVSKPNLTPLRLKTNSLSNILRL